jgi:micrococcal nuclease
MRGRLIAAGCVTALIVAAVANADTSGNFTYRGSVTHIVDGDTLDVRIGSRTERIRVIGIDTPEGGVCYANAATAAATRLASGKLVVLRGDPTQATRDRHGRLLAYVGLPGGKDLGYQLIAGGFAKVYVYNHHPFQRLAAYRAAEAIGRTRSSSLWRCGSAGTVAPIVSPSSPRTNCDPSYPDVCIPPYAKVGDLDCGQINFSNIRVVGSDPHGFDGRDQDGVGCEG